MYVCMVVGWRVRGDKVEEIWKFEIGSLTPAERGFITLRWEGQMLFFFFFFAPDVSWGTAIQQMICVWRSGCCSLALDVIDLHGY